MSESEKTLLKVRNLHVRFNTRDAVVHAATDVSFSLSEGQTLAIVGESGSGKTVSALALTRLLPEPPICEIEGQAILRGTDLLALNPRQVRKFRGKEIAYIFQEPSSSLNPVFSIGYQIAEAIRLHLPHVADVRRRVVESLEQVGIHDPGTRVDNYPHQLSGGMQQRVMIAMALACEPRVLIADEPTTALDVTIQAQIMELLRAIREETSMSVILITHNFGIISGFAHNVVVMFRGRIVESGPTEQILHHPQHPYTRALINCIPRIGARRERLTTIDYAELGAHR